MKQLTEILGGASKVGFSKAMSLGWIAIDKSAGAPKVTQKADKIDDEVQKHLAAFVQGKGDEVPGDYLYIVLSNAPFNCASRALREIVCCPILAQTEISITRLRGFIDISSHVSKV